MPTPSMSMYASQDDYLRAMAQRDLNPHKEAVAAMWLWGAEYSRSGLGSMGFWDQQNNARKMLCADMVKQIEKARPATKQEE